jgi:hypothetical protein
VISGCDSPSLYDYPGLVFFFSDEGDPFHRDNDPAHFCFEVHIIFSYLNEFASIRRLLGFNNDEFADEIIHAASSCSLFSLSS